MQKKRVAVLISGRGSNMDVLIEACKDPSFPAEIVAVLSNKAEAAGLISARSHGIAAYAVPQGDYASRSDHEAALQIILDEVQPDIICLAGYMRLISEAFSLRWEGRMINIHPALLPLYKGLDTHNRALADGVKLHGCTVHYVTAGMDDGPIIAQAAVPVLSGDDEASLGLRVLAAEHLLYPHALRLVASDQVTMQTSKQSAALVDASQARFHNVAEDPSAMLITPALPE